MTKELDYTILDQMGFEYKPVGVKYSMAAPEGVARLDRPLALCELFREAQENGPFYAMKEDIQCGDQLLGMTEFPPVMYSGALGPMFSMFKTPGANRRIYDYVPHLPKDSVTYITHAPTDPKSIGDNGIWETDDFARAEDRLIINAEVAMGSIDIYARR